MNCVLKYNKSNDKSSGLSKGAIALIILIPIIAVIIIAVLVFYFYNKTRTKNIDSQPYPSEGPLAPNSAIDTLKL